MAAQRRRATGKAPERRSWRRPTHVVGLGGSAGGLDAYEQFFANAAIDTGMAFVVVTHLDPDHATLLPELVQRTTAMPVRAIVDGTRLVADAVYVIPPNRSLVLEDDALRLRPATRRRGGVGPIDGFFRSLAHERGPTAIGVVLSGMGADGAAGVRAIKDAGGIVVVQEPSSASFDAMPRAALAAVAADAIGVPDLLPARIAALAGGARAPSEVAASDEADSEVLSRVLAIVRERTGHDLSQYKRSAIERRLARRLLVHHLDDVEAYVEYLSANPEEAELLFRELLIGVTHFFRDEDAFQVLRDVAVPALLDARRGARALRAWVAGCSTGEEAYSLAIVLHEVIHARAGASPVAVQIYATDIDDQAVATARAGRYAQDIEQHVSPERLARYFTREDHGYRIKKEIRDTVVFAKHDLINDPPFTHLDILTCRNVLIYLQPALQRELLPRFHYALGPGGLLVLGVSESVGSAADVFAPVDAKAKVFRALATAHRPPSRGMSVRTPSTANEPRAGGGLTVIDAARNAIVDCVAPPTVLVNERGDILYASRRTGRYLEPAVGKTNINIFAMAREGLGPHLSLAVRQAITRRRRVTFAGLTVRGERATSSVDLSVVPLDDPPTLRGLLLVVFEPSPPPEKGRAKRRRTGRSGTSDLERELTRMKQQLTTVVREMEASRAQVETTNEQLQAANEELQSTNEELTTSKEELQSLNEELLTLNTELEAKNEELTSVNDDLRNLLDSSKIPTLFLDRALRLKRFTSEATRVANLRSTDVGRVITDITLRIDYRDLARDVADVLETLVFKEVQVSGADGVRFTMRIHPYRTTDNRIDGVVITFFERS